MTKFPYLIIASAGLALAGCEQSQPTPFAEPAETNVAANPVASEPAASAQNADAAVAVDDPKFTTFRALGTEPFWNVAVDGKTITYTSPDNLEGVRFEATRDTDPGVLMMTGTMEDQAFVLTVRKEACSDGMSDKSYAYSATVEIGDGEQKGCALL